MGWSNIARVRVPAAAYVLAVCALTLAADFGPTLLENAATNTATGTAICPSAGAAIHTSDGAGFWAAAARHRRRTLKPSGCWLLILFLLSGDVESNPGPALRIFSQNVCSLKNKLGTLRTHSGELTRYDAICLTESWLTSHIADSELQLGLQDFTWFRRDRGSRGGGVACAVKSLLSPVHRPDLETNCETLVVQLGTVGSAFLAVCYRAPDADRETEAIADLLRGLHRTGRPFLMVGDFNLPEIHWTGAGVAELQRRTARALTFVDAIAECGAVQSVTTATRGDNILDLAVSSGGTVTSEVRSRVFPSDHLVVDTCFNVQIGPAPRVSRSKVFNYKRADFTALRQALRSVPWTVLESMDVDSAVGLFYDVVFAAINDYVPMIEIRQNFPPWFSRTVRNLLREKEQAYKRKKTDPSAANVEEHARARSQFKRAAGASYRDYLLGLVGKFKENPKRFWSFIKSLKSSGHVSPVLEYDGRIVKDTVAKANCFNECFAKKFSAPYTDALPDAPVLPSPGLSRFYVPPGRVAQLLRELSPHKACGPDGLSARILSECAEEFAIPLDIICRLSVRSGIFPSTWKRANVIPVFKKGSKKLPDNYRPVSLLALCSKILEKVVCEGLLQACLPALPSTQHGFLPKRSCVSNLTCFLEHCWTSLTKGSQTDAIYTDYSSAFTSVSHRLLLHKLHRSFNISGLALGWVESYLSQRSQRVILDGKHSDWIPVQSGVPEGSILGPLLFTCYVADLPNCLQTSSLSYADDVKIFHRINTQEDSRSLQADLERLSLWSKKWLLKLNPVKCKSITFTLRKSPHCTEYVLDGHRLERCVRVRDLGIILDSKLTFADHVDAVISKANRTLGLLIRSMQVAGRVGRTRFDHAAALAAYKAHVRSILEYGGVIWSGAAVTHLRRLERLQHRFLMWLGSNTQTSCPPLDYASLLELFGCPSIRSRLTRCDLAFARSVFSGRVDCADIVGMFPLSVPGRRTRRSELFHVPHGCGRVDSVKRGFLVRLPQLLNALTQSNPRVDLFWPSPSLKSDFASFADSQGTYLC